MFKTISKEKAEKLEKALREGGYHIIKEENKAYVRRLHYMRRLDDDIWDFDDFTISYYLRNVIFSGHFTEKMLAICEEEEKTTFFDDSRP